MKVICFKYCKFPLAILFLNYLLIVNSQTTPSLSENYIYVIEPTVSTSQADDSTTGHHSIQYFDGLGRPKQNIHVRASSSGKDIVQHVQYDDFGRRSQDFLSAPTQQTNGAFISDPISSYENYYGTGTRYDTDFYYSEKEYESSPLNRVLKQAAPGDDWAMNSGHEIKFEYTSNTSSEIEIIQVSTNWDDTDKVYKNTLKNTGKYYEEKDYFTKP